jgi:hypothetical protein
MPFMYRMPLKAWGAIGLAVVFAALMANIHGLKNQLHTVALQKDSVEAAGSATVKLNEVTWARRVVQLQFERDSIDKKLDAVSRLRAKVTVVTQVVGDTQTVAPDTANHADTTVYKFDSYKEPYRLNATVGVVPNGAAKLDWRVTKDSSRYGVRLECGPEKNGVRPASIVFHASAYESVSIDSVEQSKEVCSPGAGTQNTGISRTRAYTELGVVAVGVGVIRKYVLPLLGWK